MIMYAYREKTKAISARIKPSLVERIDYKCEQYRHMTRNKFLTYAAEFLLQTISDIECGNLQPGQLPIDLYRIVHQIVYTRMSI